MAFTAGSPELAKATKLAQQLAKLIPVFGTNGGLTGSATGVWTGGAIIEKYAKKLGFGITGLTSSSNFPPFGTVGATFGLEASLQNPRGETQANGLFMAPCTGNTLGIYCRGSVRSGADFTKQTYTGVTLATANPNAGTSFWVRGPVTVHYQDRLVFGDGAVYVVALNGNTSAGVGGTCAVPVTKAVSGSYATGAAFYVEVIGVTRTTSGIAGATFESFANNTMVSAGRTASVYFNYAAATGISWGVS